MKILILFLFTLLSKSFANTQLNVLGDPLELCSLKPLTGFTRTGYCDTNAQDQGTHLVCSTVTDAFLVYTKGQGNDLSTPIGPSFPGLKAGDNWCLCVFRWAQAFHDGVAPKVVLKSTNGKVLGYLPGLNLTISDFKG